MENSKYDALTLDRQLCFPLYAASREIIKLYRPYLDALNLTYTQYVTMMVIWEMEIVNSKELGARLYLDSGTLTPVLKSLEVKGWIKRYRSPHDERILMVELTPSGRELREEALSIPTRVAKCIGLEREEGAQLYALLYKLLKKESDKQL